MLATTKEHLCKATAHNIPLDATKNFDILTSPPSSTCQPVPYPPVTWYILHVHIMYIQKYTLYRCVFLLQKGHFQPAMLVSWRLIPWAPKRGRLQRIATALGKELQTQRTKHRHAQLSWLSLTKSQVDFRKSKEKNSYCIVIVGTGVTCAHLYSSYVLMFIILALIKLKLRWS